MGHLARTNILPSYPSESTPNLIASNPDPLVKGTKRSRAHGAEQRLAIACRHQTPAFETHLQHIFATSMDITSNKLLSAAAGS